jgi:DNA-binding PadR family transcriptional regulator
MCARRGEFGWGGDWGAAWSAWCGPGFQAGPRRSGRHRRGRRSFFDRGDLKYVILRLLARKPMHGYEVMQAIEQESGGWYAASAGSVYPALQLLQDQGYVTSQEEDGRRVYRITEEGRAFLERHTDRVDDVMDRVADFAGRFSGHEMGELTQAFMRFARTSFEQAMSAAGDPEAVTRIKEILERAAREMQQGGRRSEPPRDTGGRDA